MKRILSVVILFPLLAVVVLAEETELKPSRRAEEFVKQKARAGETADLQVAFPNEADRALGSEFLYNLLTNSIPGLKVHRHGVSIAHATFPEAIDLVNTEVPFNVQLIGCHFLDDVELSQSHFKRNLSLSESEFDSVMNFIDAVVDGNLDVSKTNFGNTEGEADLEGLHVGGDFDLHEAVFTGNASFIRNNIGKNINAIGARFTSTRNEISFDSMQVDGYAFFQESAFSFSANFAYARIGQNFGADTTRFGDSSPNTEIIFNSMKVGRNAFFHKTIFNASVDFSNMDVAGKFEPSDAQFNEAVRPTSFTGMKADVADFRRARFAGEYQLAGMTYRELRADDPKALVGKAAYSEDTYTNLASFLNRQGMEGSANDVYIAQKRRERSGLNLAGKVGSVLLDLLVGYGRRPWLAFIWSSLFVFVGWLVFRRRKEMEPQKPEYENRPYSAFWYSLDLFLPFVDLQAAGFWSPRRERRFARTYVAIHTLLGWILVPVGLAAVSGLIK